MKARFVTEQPAFRVITRSGTDYVFICVNGEKKVDEADEYIEYDYNEFQAPVGVLDLAAIENNPSAYLDYVPGQDEPTPEERITVLEEKMAGTQLALRELCAAQGSLPENLRAAVTKLLG